ncbi:MAG TPA: hypothetical protein DCP92_10960 [Nitrospiraceae bacterium]|jgi:SAM-dependent methyltransferase|nr:hypothetical protein [Nitrospiraceae bacterium]
MSTGNIASIRAFFKKTKDKIFGATQCSEDSPASDNSSLLIANVREKRLARAYIDAVAKNRSTFVDLIDPDDEMYLFAKNNIGQKETASYLYFKSGMEALQCIENIVRFGGKSFGDIESFLDFACGYGKSTRFLIQELDLDKVWVSDIYEGAVDFQKKYFGVNGFYSQTEPSKLEFPRKFEVIYVGSLFSHLPANRFEEWLLTLYNVLEDHGILILSTHGESLCPAGCQVDPSGFTFLRSSESRSLSTEEYGSTFVTSEWVKKLARKLGIINIYFMEKELWGSQDIYVITKKKMSLLNNLRTNNFPRGNVESIQISKDGDIRVIGWAIDKEFGAPVKEVCIYAEDELLGKATLGMLRPDVEKHFGRADCLKSGWEYNGGDFVKDKFGEKDPSIIIKALIKGHRSEVTYLMSIEPLKQ